jgi:Na+/proline symporter
MLPGPMQMSPLAVAVVVAYLALTTILGIALGRKARSARDWAVAGGSLGTFVLAFAIAGTRIGGAGVYGVAGDVMNGGVWNLVWYSISTFLALALVGLFFAIPFRRLALQTVGEAFTRRFGTRRAQTLTSLCVQTEYLIVNVIEVYVTAGLLRFMTGIGVPEATLAATFVLVSYTAFGGMWGAAVTNLVHCAVIVFGLASVVVLGTASFGGWDGVVAAAGAKLAAAGRDEAVFWSIAGAGWAPVVAMIFSAAIHTPAASIYANFSTAARTEEQLPRTFVLAGLGAAVMPALAGLIGILTFARYGASQGLSGYGTITTFATETHPLLGGLAVAAVLAAVVSTGGPILLSSATLFVRDWMPARFSDTPQKTLKAYRAATVGYGVVSALLSLAVVKTGISLLSLLLFGYATVVPPAIALFYLFYWPRATERALVWGMGLGYAASIAAYAAVRFGWSDWDPSYASTLVPLVAVPLLVAFDRPASDTDDRARRDAFFATLRTKTSG